VIEQPEAAGGLIRITDVEFEQFRRLAYKEAGLDLHCGKQHLVTARLAKKVRQLNLGSFQDYYLHVTRDRTGEALASMIDALTTNYTSFLRERPHFDFLAEVLLPHVHARQEIGIWSAACATGEEPYSIAFWLLEKLGIEAAHRISILATDISTRTLEIARAGIYPAERFEDVPRHWLPAYLLQGRRQWEGSYRVKPEIQRLIQFRRLNLTEQFLQVGLYPVIFCRNVMIYFDKPTQQHLVEKLTACLEPGGYLFIGHAESFTGIRHSLEYVCPAVYRKRGSHPIEGRGCPS
jgi:chemotaxis protein methyltransferase CheR